MPRIPEIVPADIKPAPISGDFHAGDQCRFDVCGNNFRNTGHSNESSPRVVTVQAEADEYEGSIHVRGAECVLCTGRDTGEGRISQLYARAADRKSVV